jgi:flagellin
MGLRINQNIAAMNAYRNLTVTDGQMSKSLEKLSSGYRINRAADDAAGLSISEGLRAQIGGTNVAIRNAQDGISVVQTAEGALSEVHSILQRMRDLAVQSANSGSQDANAVAAAQTESDNLVSELNRISSTTSFGQTKLLDGTFGKTYQDATVTTTKAAFNTAAGKTFTITTGGATTGNITLAAASDLNGDGVTDQKDIQQQLTTSIRAALTAAGKNANDVSVSVTDNDGDGTYSVKFNGTGAFSVQDSGTAGALAGLGSGAGPITVATATGSGGNFHVGANTNAADDIAVAVGAMDATTLGVNALSLSTNATGAINAIDSAISAVSTQRANLGAYQNRFEHTIANLSVASENLSASESRIRDTDMAKEMVNFTRAQILTQAGTAMLAQANQAPQQVLKLLQ